MYGMVNRLKIRVFGFIYFIILTAHLGQEVDIKDVFTYRNKREVQDMFRF